MGFKRKVVKIEFRPVLWPMVPDDPIAIFTGSGDSSFVDELIDRMWAGVEKSREKGFDKIVQIMIKENRKYHREIWSIYPTATSIDQLPDADLLFAVWAKNGFGLFSCASTRFKPIPTFATIGCGGELAHYLCADAHNSGTQTESCIALAAHMLEQVKANVIGCGGESYIAVLTKTGAAQLLRRPDAEDIGKHLAEGEHIVKQMLLASANVGINDREFRRSLNVCSKLLMDSRKALRQSKEKRRKKLAALLMKMWTRPKGGTPMPSVSRRSGPEQ